MQELYFLISQPPLAEMGYLQEEINAPAKSGSIDGFQGEAELQSQTGAPQNSTFSCRYFSDEAYFCPKSLPHVNVNLQPQMWAHQAACGNWKKSWVNEYSSGPRGKKMANLGLFILEMRRWKGNIITSKCIKDCCKRSSFFSLFSCQMGQEIMCLSCRKIQVRH